MSFQIRIPDDATLISLVDLAVGQFGHDQLHNQVFIRTLKGATCLSEVGMSWAISEPVSELAKHSFPRVRPLPKGTEITLIVE